jgi:glycyl-tRNA synthetase
MATTEESLRKSLTEKLSAVELQADTVRTLKSSSAPKPDIDAAVQALNALKLEKSTIEKSLRSLLSGSDSREAFRQSLVNTLERRLFYIPSFKIYGGIAGLYDYGPPGCAVKSNVLSRWRQVTVTNSYEILSIVNFVILLTLSILHVNPIKNFMLAVYMN